MFYLNKPKTIVYDGSDKIVGFIIQKRFTQDDFSIDKSGRSVKVDILYNDGLSGMELEQISELMQREIR